MTKWNRNDFVILKMQIFFSPISNILNWITISYVPKFCKRKRPFQWYQDQSDSLNRAQDMYENAQKFEWKTRSKISCNYT